jgi:hypothetical protein
MVSVDLSDAPPTPVLWLTYGLDSLCSARLPFFVVDSDSNDDNNKDSSNKNNSNRHGWCSDWRASWGVDPESGLAQRVPTLSSSLPPLLTFAQYRRQSQNEQQPGEAAAAGSRGWKSLWGDAYGYAFGTSSTALGDLSTPEAAAALAVTVLLLRLVKRGLLVPAFRRAGREAAVRTHGPAWADRNPDRIDKFAEYAFRLLYHLGISCLGYRWFVLQEPWWDFMPLSQGWDGGVAGATMHLYANYPHHPVTPHMAWYYLVQAAYNLDALVSLVELSVVWTARDPFRWSWSPTVRGDFHEMFFHHVVTNLLVVGSSKCRLTRIGSMVFYIHDVSDVPVDLSKLAHFVRWKATTVMCFCTMVAIWCYTRLFLLPFVIYRSVLTQSVYLCGYSISPPSGGGHANDGAAVVVEGVSRLLYMVYRHAFYVLVAFLILLHAVWFFMFLRIFHSLLFKRKVEDLSEHKSGEYDDEPHHQHHPIYRNGDQGERKKQEEKKMD